MNKQLNIAVSVFAGLFVLSIFLIMAMFSLDSQILSVLLTLVSLIVSIIVFFMSIAYDMRERKRKEIADHD